MRPYSRTTAEPSTERREWPAPPAGRPARAVAQDVENRSHQPNQDHQPHGSQVGEQVATVHAVYAPIARVTKVAKIPTKVGSHSQGLTKLVRAWSKMLDSQLPG